ncbi:DUF4863 family protein [uncultured Ruegeria sp.]|uniref:4-hydroxylaminobenzoate lyase n=1 Tax=uncultured Ruegeria sp. TaxID=259304 RepID=UPI00261DAC24|nr:DUF4863 family protein [uncultured Ruegeria sp.]
MAQQDFIDLVGKIAGKIADAPLDQALEAQLNRDLAPGSSDFSKLGNLCAEGERDGWLMAREAGGIKYGRAVKPGEIPGNFSVDVVRMKDVRGPHHIHTQGEIGAIFPLDGEPAFDGKPEGWYVYGPGSEHHPTVTGGDAYVLYFLPEGAIEFTGK